jgi:hypothetical protein
VSQPPRLEWVGFVRSYLCEPACEATELEEPPPVELIKWVDARYRPHLGYVRLPEVTVEAFGSEFTLGRHLLLHRASPVVDVVLTCEDGALPRDLYDESWRFITGEVAFGTSDGVRRLEDLWDDAAREVLHERADYENGKTAFGCVAIFAGPEQSEVALDNTDDRVRSTGIEAHHSVMLERNRLMAIVHQGHDSSVAARDSAWGYVLLATVCVHSRHFASHILESIRRVAELSFEDRLPEDVLNEAAAVQKTALVTRPLSHATNYLGHPALVGLFDESATIAALGQRDRDHLDAALDGLDKLVNGIAAAATARSQRRLNAIGFILALMGVLIGATNIVVIVRGRTSDNLWIFATWAVVLIATGFTFIRTRPTGRIP